MAKAIVLFSGGLDSQLATKLMIDQGVEVEAITSASVFHHATAALAENHPTVKAARRLGVPHTLLDTDAEMLELVKHPQFGRGKNMNPCIDCRMFLLRKAGQVMRERGADFIVSGEVLGQRPMSQHRQAMEKIERTADVVGLVLRPLCAKLLDPSIAEQKGWVDREKLFDISGRSRKRQMALAEELGITDYPSPAGGCLLTDPGFATRLVELLGHTDDPDLNDVELLRVGRHFRLDETTKLAVGRDQAENELLEGLAREGDRLLDAVDVMGPTCLLRGDASESAIAAAARLTVKYGKARGEPSARIAVRTAGTDERTERTAPPATADEVAALDDHEVRMSDDLLRQLDELKRDRNAVILAHNYQRPEVQDAADFTGDSLGLSRQAAKTEAEVILFCGVHFMAETAAIICRDKTVLIPDANAGCPMANMITARELTEAKRQHPGAVVVCYVNSTAEIKAISDLCCTSANAVAVVDSIPRDHEVLFVPDQSLGSWVAKQLGRELILWPGYCPTHHRILPEHVERAKQAHPDAEVVVHPECLDAVVAMADQVASTSGMLRYCGESAATEFIIGTELGMLHPLAKQNPGKSFHAASPLSDCPNMKLTTVEKMVWALEDGVHRVAVADDVAQRARNAIDRMLAIG